MLSKIIEKSKWNFSRWLVMDHPGEDIYRLRQQYQHAVIDRMKVGKETRTGEIRFKAASHLKYSGENIKELLRSLPSWNTYSIFAEAQVDLTEPVEWRKDYKNNIVSDLGPGHKVKRKLFEEVGETKYVFELNRMHHLPVMALYAVVNDNLGDDMIIDGGEVVELIENQLVEWDKQNPYLNSINWSSGIEVALRAINLVYVRNILEEVYEPRYGLDILLDRLVVQHAHYLQSHLSLFSSANNHLVAELAGLVIICCSYEFNKSNDWLQMAWKRMLGQIKSQVNEDGFNKEQSTRYHAAAINSWLSAFQFAESNGMKADDSHWKKLDMMIGFLYKLGNTKGFTIEFGDSDDSELVYPYNDPDYNLYGSIHTSGAIQFDKQGYLKKYGRFDVRNYLVHGDEGFEKFRLLSQSDAIKEEITEASGFYKDSGYVIYNEDDSKLVFDVGFVGLGALAAHGHADILHFVLEIDEIPVIIDTGTYQYHNNFADWRSYFRGSHAHNTIAPAGLDQLKSTGPMMWHTKPKVDLLNIQNDSSKVSCEASHNGFQNQKRNIKHTRRIEYYKGSKVYEVIDKLDGQGTEPLYFYLHLDKGIEKFQHEKEKVVLQLQNGKKVTLENKEFGNLQMFKGNDELPLGWQSTRYDHKEPAITLRLPINLSGSFEMKTIIDFNN